MLAQELSTLYSTFSRNCPLKDNIMDRCCTHCPPDRAFIEIQNKPLRSISSEDFGPYPGKAMTTWGDGEDFKYFLPRLLELNIYLLEYNFYFISKLLDADFQSWPEEERHALITYCDKNLYYLLCTDISKAYIWANILAEFNNRIFPIFQLNVESFIPAFQATLNAEPSPENEDSITKLIEIYCLLSQNSDISNLMSFFTADPKHIMHFIQFYNYYNSLEYKVVSSKNIEWAKQYQQILNQAFFNEGFQAHISQLSEAEQVLGSCLQNIHQQSSNFTF